MLRFRRSRRQATLRLGVDNWAIVYLNGRQLVMLDHAEEFETVRIPISLRKGDNQLLIKTNIRNSAFGLWKACPALTKGGILRNTFSHEPELLRCCSDGGRFPLYLRFGGGIWLEVAVQWAGFVRVDSQVQLRELKQ